MAEGYNSKINNRKEIGSHPNPYLLCSYIKGQLHFGERSAKACAAGTNSKKCKNLKFQRLKTRKKTLMAEYHGLHGDLKEYMISIGCAALDLDDRVHQSAHDFDPDEEDDFDFDDLPPMPRTAPKKIKPLSGQDLRKARSENKSQNFDESIDVSKVKHSGASHNKTNGKKILHPNPEIPEKEHLITIEDGFRQSKATLKAMKYKLSPSQPDTPGDGKFTQIQYFAITYTLGS